MDRALIKIGPTGHGRRISLAEFEHATVQEGDLYELSREIITVSEVPNRRHALQLIAIRRQLATYDVLHPGRIAGILGGADCKLLIGGLESERHPDIAIDMTEPPPIENATLWRHCFPEIVIEVVSPSSRKRDYEEEPEGSLRLGAKEYRIVDGRDKVMVVMRRVRNRLVEGRIEPPATYQTRRLPGLEFSVGEVFRAAGLT